MGDEHISSENRTWGQDRDLVNYRLEQAEDKLESVEDIDKRLAQLEAKVKIWASIAGGIGAGGGWLVGAIF